MTNERAKRWKEYLHFRRDDKVLEQIAMENIRNMYLICVCVVIFEALSLTMYLIRQGRSLRVIGQVMFCVAGCGLIALVSKQVQRNHEAGKKVSTVFVNVIIACFYMIMTTWGILIDTAHYANGEQMLTFYIVQFCFGVFILFVPKIGAVLFVFGFAAFLCAVCYAGGVANIQLENLFIFLLIMISGYYIRFRHKYLEIIEGHKSRTVSQEMEQLKEYEKKINDSIRISLYAKDPEENINTMLQYLGEMFDADRAYIFEKNTRNEDDNTFEWCAKGVVPQKEKLQNIPPEVCDLWYRTFQNKKAVVIRDVEDIKVSDPLVYKTLKPQAIHSLVSFAVYDERKMIGFFGMDNPSNECMGMSEDIWGIISNFYASLLRKRNLVRQLKQISYIDAVTGADNRFAMYAHFEKLKDCENIGVAFCDITGLKETNDTKGHSAGDRLIRETYRCLAEQFDQHEVFRIGGDEFTVLCSDISETEFAARISLIRLNLEKKEIVAAIGVDFQAHVAQTVDQTIALAEKNMYAEKSAWYRKMGKERRK